jgi:hypothetical protein
MRDDVCHCQASQAVQDMSLRMHLANKATLRTKVIDVNIIYKNINKTKFYINRLSFNEVMTQYKSERFF